LILNGKIVLSGATVFAVRKAADESVAQPVQNSSQQSKCEAAVAAADLRLSQAPTARAIVLGVTESQRKHGSCSDGAPPLDQEEAKEK